MSDGSVVWDDFEGMPVASLPAKFRMPDIERYTGIGCPRLHLRLYINRDEGSWFGRVSDDYSNPAISEWGSPAMVRFLGVFTTPNVG